MSKIRLAKANTSSVTPKCKPGGLNDFIKYRLPISSKSVFIVNPNGHSSVGVKVDNLKTKIAIKHKFGMQAAKNHKKSRLHFVRDSSSPWGIDSEVCKIIPYSIGHVEYQLQSKSLIKSTNKSKKVFPTRRQFEKMLKTQFHTITRQNKLCRIVYQPSVIALGNNYEIVEIIF